MLGMAELSPFQPGMGLVALPTPPAAPDPAATLTLHPLGMHHPWVRSGGACGPRSGAGLSSGAALEAGGCLTPPSPQILPAASLPGHISLVHSLLLSQFPPARKLYCPLCKEYTASI